MRTMFFASLILVCTCAHALDDTPTQNVYMGPRGEDVRPQARVRQELPPPAHRSSDNADEARRAVRSAAVTAPAVSSGRNGVQPWLAIRQSAPSERGGQK
jgi:hypothetical protein